MKSMKGSEGKYSHGGDIYRNDIYLDFSVNGNPLGPPASVISLLSDPLMIKKLLTAYPDPECASLKSAIASMDGLSRDMVLCTNGAAEFICCLTKAISPKKGLVLTPAFFEYERCLEAMNAECVFSDDENSFIQAIKTVDIAFLCNPVNPTGVLLDVSFLKKALETAQSNNTYLVIDESFLRFLDNFGVLTFRSFVNDYNKLVIVDSFTKIYAIPGLRLGFGLTADGSLLKKMKTMLPMWNVSTLSQAAGIKAIEAGQYVEDTVAYLKDERQRLTVILEDMGFIVTPGAADFIFFRSDFELYYALLSSGILIRDCSNYRGIGNGAYNYRIAIRKKAENDLLMTLIKDIIEA